MSFPCPYCGKIADDHRVCRRRSLDVQRRSVRNFIQQDISGKSIAKSLKLYTADDELVCPECHPLHGKVFPTQTPEQINIVMENSHVKKCKNPVCRCYWRPEEISLI